MITVKYEQIKKDFPEKASELLQEQETLVLFLNLPVRKNWMTIIKLSDEEQKRVNKIVERYAKLKIEEENKLKPKSKEEIMEIENNTLKKIFEARMVKVGHVKNKFEAVKIAKGLAKEEFPKGVILDANKLDKLTTLAGADSTRITPTDVLVFDPENVKIISYELVIGENL